jgi:hypothetical protein
MAEVERKLGGDQRDGVHDRFLLLRRKNQRVVAGGVIV